MSKAITETRKEYLSLGIYLSRLKLIIMILMVEMTDGLKEFTDIGNNFAFVTKGVSPARYEECVKQLFGERTELTKDCYGFVLHDNHKSVIPLYTDFKNTLLNNEGAVRFWGL